MRFCSPSVALCAPLTRPLFFTGVKRGVCSQINHFPEDADFDHDGAEYVLRKSTLQHCKKNLMNDKAEQSALQWPFIHPFKLRDYIVIIRIQSVLL